MTPTLSVDAFQPRVIDVCVLPVAETPVGVVGACVSPAGQAEVEADIAVVDERLPAASYAVTSSV